MLFTRQKLASKCDVTLELYRIYSTHSYISIKSVATSYVPENSVIGKDVCECQEATLTFQVVTESQEQH